MRLIDADVLLCNGRLNIKDLSIGIEYIISAPTIDAIPLVHAIPIETMPDEFGNRMCDCSNCGWANPLGSNFCNECGARLDMLDG